MIIKEVMSFLKKTEEDNVGLKAIYIVTTYKPSVGLILYPIQHQQPSNFSETTGKQISFSLKRRTNILSYTLLINRLFCYFNIDKVLCVSVCVFVCSQTPHRPFEGFTSFLEKRCFSYPGYTLSIFSVLELNIKVAMPAKVTKCST